MRDSDVVAGGHDVRLTDGECFHTAPVPSSNPDQTGWMGARVQ